MSNRTFRPGLMLAAGTCLFAVGFTLLGAGCGSGPSSEKSPAATATGQYAFWPLFPDEPRIQFIQSFGSRADLSAEIQRARRTGVRQGLDVRSHDQEALTASAMHNGKIYVCDIRSGVRCWI